MKRILLFVVAAVFLLTGTARAGLMVYEYVTGEKVTLDTATGNYWYWNLADFVNMTYAEQMSDIAGLGTYGDIAGGWHMADHDEMTQLWGYSTSDLTSAFAPSYSNIDWVGRSDHLASADYHYTPAICYGTQNYGLHGIKISDSFSHRAYGAWVTTSSTVVPVPGALILAATGLLSSTLGLKRLRRKR